MTMTIFARRKRLALLTLTLHDSTKTYIFTKCRTIIDDIIIQHSRTYTFGTIGISIHLDPNLTFFFVQFVTDNSGVDPRVNITTPQNNPNLTSPNSTYPPAQPT